MLTFNLPLADVIYDMHDKLKSVTRGYGTMDYELIGYFPAELCKLDIMVGGKRVDALSIICDRREADRRGRAIVKKLRGEIDRHMFEIALQAAIGTPDHRPRNDFGHAQERHGQVLRRRHLAQAQVVGQAEGRQEADEIDRLGRHSAEGISGRARHDGGEVGGKRKENRKDAEAQKRTNTEKANSDCGIRNDEEGEDQDAER